MGDSIRFPQGFKIDNRRIFLPRIGWVDFYKSCEIEGKIKNITVSSRGGRWYASIQIEQTVEMAKHPSESEIGIDAGIKCFVALSDGTMVEGVNSFRKHEYALAREQRKLSRKKKGSNNWKKQKREISRLHIKIANRACELSEANAAKNILTVGQTGMACEANRIGGRQQEPADIRKEILSMAL